MAPELVLLIGLPGAGKSTFYRECFVDTHILVSKDLIPRSADKAKRQRALIGAALAEGRSVVVDNLNVSRAERAQALDAARPFAPRVVAYRFAESVADCRERNGLREGPARVPLVALYAAARRYEEPLPEEGIDVIHVVRLRRDGFNIDA